MRLWPALLLLLTTPAWAEFVEVPGGRLWYESRGEGPALVLLHDGLVSSATWDDQMPAFSRLYRTIRYDRRGYGKSESNREPYSHLDDLATFLDALKIDRAVLVGCDNGARLALDYALAHPDRVSALVLSGPVVSGFPFSEHFMRRGMANMKPLFQDHDFAGMVDAWVRDPYETAPANTRARERLRELFKLASPLTNGFPDSRTPDRPALGHLGEVHIPTLIVVGESDIADIHAQSGALETGIPGARRVVLAGAGHLAHLEKPELFNETVLGFLRSPNAPVPEPKPRP